MGINDKIKKMNKSKNLPIIQIKLEEELRSCMNCKYFYGRSSQCIAQNCVKKSKEKALTELDTNHLCYGCSYRQSEQYCFPCMKKILSK